MPCPLGHWVECLIVAATTQGTQSFVTNQQPTPNQVIANQPTSPTSQPMARESHTDCRKWLSVITLIVYIEQLHVVIVVAPCTKKQKPLAQSPRRAPMLESGALSAHPQKKSLAIGARDAGNENWNDPELNHPVPMVSFVGIRIPKGLIPSFPSEHQEDKLVFQQTSASQSSWIGFGQLPKQLLPCFAN